MPFIYKIINDVNQKLYVGKTSLLSIEDRFKQHCKDYNRPRCDKRPLYEAMSKYGIENFHIELIEEVENDEIACEREIFWINQLRTYIGFEDCNGYNATLGGDGKAYLDRGIILQMYNTYKSVIKIAHILKADASWISKILKSCGVSEEEIYNNGKKACARVVYMIDSKTLTLLQEFDSVADAAIFCQENGLSKDAVSGISAHISQCCNGIRKSAYKHKWVYKDCI